MATASRMSGSESPTVLARRASARAWRPDGRGTTTNRTAIGMAATAVPRMTVCQVAPASMSRPTTSGEASAPEAEEQVEEVECAAATVG